MRLQANLHWKENQGIALPSVRAVLERFPDFFTVQFLVEEPRACFDVQMERDGGRAWEESCVEIFVNALDGSGDYCNFEFTSRGFCYAAKGRDRAHRQEITPAQYASIHRKVDPPREEKDSVFWGLKALIPGCLIGCEGFVHRNKILGNLYKCGDRCATPHYLSAFPIDRERPDFHCPEFFRELA